MVKYRVETKNGSFLGILEGKRNLKNFLRCMTVKAEDCVLVKLKPESKAKTYTIYDNYDVYSEENMKDAKEQFLEADYSEEEIDEEMCQAVCNDNDSLWFDDELSELRRVSEGSLIAIADLGLWNGRHSGYKEIKSLEDILYSSCDYERVYVDSNGDIWKDESHHDGSNSILYRYWKDSITEEQKENFLDKIYHGKATRKDVTRYTRKAGLAIAEVYGWKVRA